MADFSQLPALDIDPVGFGAKDALAQAQAQNAQQALVAAKAANLEQQQLAPDVLAAKKAQLQEQTTLAPLDTTSAQQRSQLETTDYGNKQLAQVAAATAAADPTDAPDIWDDGMKKAAANGVTTASQYIGHYRPDLAERVQDVYGGAGSGQRGAGGAGAAEASSGGADPVQIQRAVASMPIGQAQTALRNLNRAITSFNGVKDQASWDAEMTNLQESGINVDAFLPNTDWNPLNYAAASRVVKSLTPYRDAVAQRVAITDVGGAAPAAGQLYEPDYALAGVNTTGKPVYFDKHSAAERVGESTIGAKPSAATGTFMMKQNAWLSAHPGDQQGALEFANGKRSMDPSQMQVEALNQANKELGDAVLAGAQIDDPDKWVRQRTAQNFQQISSASFSAPGSNGTPGATTSGGAALPARAVQAVKAAGGKPVKFNNGTVYKMGANGQPIRVQ